MCCWTHPYRDEAAQRAGEILDLVIFDDPFRCQCGYSTPCRRRATEEDQLCDWCRGTDHEQACNEFGPYGYTQPGSRVLVTDVASAASYILERYDPPPWGGGVIR